MATPKPINRVTMFKLPNDNDRQQLVQAYTKMRKEAVKCVYISRPSTFYERPLPQEPTDVDPTETASHTSYHFPSARL